MLKQLGRALFLLIGLALLTDAFLTQRQQTLTVDQHTSQTDDNRSRSGGVGWGDTSYTLHFAGGCPRSCSVGYTAYHAVSDGDPVEVTSTRLFGNCTEIVSGGQIVVRDGLWRLWQAGGGLVMIAVALGWVRSEEDD